MDVYQPDKTQCTYFYYCLKSCVIKTVLLVAVLNEDGEKEN